jgi:hypothetical protein
VKFLVAALAVAPWVTFAIPSRVEATNASAFVQSGFSRIASGNAVTATFPSVTTSGNLIVAYVLWSNMGAVSISDSLGNTYTGAVGPTQWSGTSNAQIFFAKGNKGGSTTVTATFATAVDGYGLLYIHEYSGLDQTNPLDSSTGASGPSGSLDSGSLTTLNANDVLFAAGASSASVTSAGSDYAVRSTAAGNLTADRTVIETGSYNATASQNGSAWVMQLVALRAATESSPPPASPSATSTSTAIAPPPPPGPVMYPLKASANHRYLVDQRGVPFLLVGDSPQSLIGNVSEADADSYFANRQTDGFNAVWINLLCNSYTFCRSDGATLDGIAPFTVAGDVSTPNEAYFTKVDHILQFAANRGILVFLNPLETGGWLGFARKNGTVKTNNYGQYIGNRYKNYSNIVWFFGNDFQSWQTSSDDALIETLAQGIKNTNPNYLGTTELNYSKSASLDDASWAPLLDFDGAYTYFPTFDQVLREYNRATIPVFMEEANYEFEHNFTDDGSPLILRRQEYWTLLSGAAGQLYGNLYTVRFQTGWQSNLDTTGARQLGYVTSLFGARAWYNLVPDEAHTIVTAGYGTYDGSTTLTNSNYATAAATPDGSLVLAYMPAARTITVDMTRLSGPATARWYDPSNGTFSDISNSLPNSGTTQFTPSNNNADGDSDWVLVLESGSIQPPTIPDTDSNSDPNSDATGD